MDRDAYVEQLNELMDELEPVLTGKKVDVVLGAVLEVIQDAAISEGGDPTAVRVITKAMRTLADFLDAQYLSPVPSNKVLQ